MAIRKAIEGWETTHVSDTAAIHLYDIQKARSGKGYAKCLAEIASSASLRFDIQPGHLPLNGGVADGLVTNGNQGKCVTRFYLRSLILPSTNVELFSVNHNTNQSSGIVLNTNGTLACFTSVSAVPTAGTASAMVVTPVSDSNFDKWYEIIFSVTVTNNFPSTTHTYTLSCQITSPAGIVETVTRTIGIAGGGMAMQNVGFFPVSSAYSQNGTCDLDLEDIVIINTTNADVVSAVLPPENRIAAFFPTGQATAGWIGDWSLVARTRWSNLIVYQEALSVGLQTTFLRDTAASQGIESIGGVQLVGVITSNGTSVSKFVFDGSVVDGDVVSVSSVPGVTNNVPTYCSIAPMSLAAFDAASFGVQSNNVTYTRLWTFCILVLYSGTAHTPRERSTGGGFKLTWIEWTGTGVGVASRAITGVGFAPHLIIVTPLFAHANPIVIRHGDLPVSFSQDQSGGGEHEAIISIDDDGFTIRGVLNNINGHFTALCIRDDGDSEAGRILLHGSAGKNAASIAKSVTLGYGVNLQPAIFHGGRLSGSAASHLKTSDMPATSATPLLTGTIVNTVIQSFDANGFTFGTAATGLNDGTIGYQWFGFTAIPEELSTAIAIGKIDPIGVPVQVQLAVGFEPYMVVAKGSNNAIAGRRINETVEYSGTSCSAWGDSNITKTRSITQLSGAGGTFTIDGGASSEHLNVTTTCYWLAFARDAELLPPTEYVFDPDQLITIGLVWAEVYLPD